jgi:MurNAc alpha-1-phosphate uridylyltransferase
MQIKKAMILAAGRGQRMGELTANLPKPLLRIGNRYLIEYAIANLKAAGINEIVINISYQAEQIKTALGDGSHYGLKIIYSQEKERLETGGGIFQALPVFGGQPFIVLSADVISDYPLQELPQQPQGLAHLIMVANPPYHPRGDYSLKEGHLIIQAKEEAVKEAGDVNEVADMKEELSLKTLSSPFVTDTLTFANIAVYRPELFANCLPGHFRLTQVLNPAIAAGQVSGQEYKGMWYNIGTPGDLDEARIAFSSSMMHS